ncbi:MAG TPA: hypothetical protein VII12_17025 [Thermoanaerobaculia bacterium]|jgi:hypothetical protein
MKKTLVFTILLVAAAAFAGEHHHATAASSPGFDKMKALVGEWTANVPNMGKVTATYSMHSDGTALLEELKMPAEHGEQSMISVYYPVGGDIAMTHYCSGHNQPHMKASGTDGQTVKFAAKSIDNLASANDQHMDGVQFTFKDADHFTAAWTNVDGGKTMTVPFEFTRVR